MRTLDLELETGGAAMSELRPILDAAIADHFDDGFLRHRWEGDVLRLSGPGARGSLACEAGRLRLRAVLRPPASWVHRVIQRKLDAALEDVSAACGGGLEETAISPDQDLPSRSAGSARRARPRSRSSS